MGNPTNCKHEDCENQATEVLVTMPSMDMVLDGAVTANFLCGKDGHTAKNLAASIRHYDKNALVWVFMVAEPVTDGTVYAALATGATA